MRSLLLRVVLGTMLVKPMPWARQAASSLAVMGVGMSPDWYRHGPRGVGEGEGRGGEERGGEGRGRYKHNLTE